VSIIKIRFSAPVFKNTRMAILYLENHHYVLINSANSKKTKI